MDLIDTELKITVINISSELNDNIENVGRKLVTYNYKKEPTRNSRTKNTIT